jgi:two-component system, LytTR family, sensor kinase
LIIYTRDFKLASIDFKTTVSILVTILLLAISVYINMLWLIPVFFNRHRFLLYSLLQLLNIGLFICFNYFVSAAFEGKFPRHYMNEVIAEFILVLIFLVVSTLVKFTRDSVSLQDAELKIKEIQRQKIESELEALKTQVNPHFFFNTLNSLYSLSLDKSDKVPELILKLSGLMRYMLYETRDDLVPMSKQLEFLQSYLYLEKLRLDDTTTIDFNVIGSHKEVSITPLLFLPLIENAFKHGAKEKSARPYIRVDVDLSNPESVIFVVENNTDPVPGKESRGKEGIGLINVRKRLDLLYPSRHQLEINFSEGIFRAELTIDTR